MPNARKFIAIENGDRKYDAFQNNASLNIDEIESRALFNVHA